MRSLISVSLALLALIWVAPAQARTCLVTFQKCDIEIGGKCLKWNKKSVTIQRHEARNICRRLSREYNRIRRCDTSRCGQVDRPSNREFWQMETRNRRVIREYGRGNHARFECQRDLERLQCDRRRNRHATCVGYYRGRVFDRIGPFCRGPRR